MTRCRLCILPDTRPDTAFVDGICSACIAYAARPEIDWVQRLAQLDQLLDRARAYAKANGNAFDCIVPSSGGKDSTYQVMTLLERGARPLVVTASTCHLTPIGRMNIDNLARYATTIEVTPNRTMRAKLNRMGLEMVGDISWPEHISIHTVPFRVAMQLDVPLIFYGENPTSQYGGPLDVQEQRRMTRRWTMEFGGFLGLRPQDLIGTNGLTDRDMSDYMGPNDKQLDDAGVEAHFLGQYIPWDSHRNAKIAQDAGMKQVLPCRANWWIGENEDNLDTFWHDHVMYRKFGYGRAGAQLSVDIRLGKISREDALQIVRERDGMMVEKYMELPVSLSIERIGMSKQEFAACLDRFTSWNLFSYVDKSGRPILLEFA